MAVVHPLDNTFWIDAHRYKDAELSYYSSLSKLQNNVNPSLLNEVNSNKPNSKKNKKNDPNISVHVTISQITDIQNPSANANIETKDPGNVSGGKKKRNKNKSKTGANAPENSLAAQVQKARQQLQNQLQNCDKGSNTSLTDLVLKLEEDKLKLEKVVASLVSRISALELTVSKLQDSKSKSVTTSVPQKSVATSPAAAAAKKEEDDDDVDLFGSDSEGEDEAAAKIREERLAAYAAKKSKKPPLIEKSTIIFDVKPWDVETNMKDLESVVRSIVQDGLFWGAAKLVPLAYGIHKMQISCVIDNNKVSVDEIQESIENVGSAYVQSVDIAAFNKI